MKTVQCLKSTSLSKEIDTLFDAVRPKITFIFDTSGSMPMCVFEKAFEIMDKLAVKSKQINLIQWSYVCESITTYRKGDGDNRVQIRGMAGTCLDKAVEFLQEHPYWKGDLNFVLTDGIFDHRSLKPDDDITFLIVARTDAEYETNRPKGFKSILFPITYGEKA